MKTVLKFVQCISSVWFIFLFQSRQAFRGVRYILRRNIKTATENNYNYNYIFTSFIKKNRDNTSYIVHETQSELIRQWATPHHLSDVRRGAPY